MIKITIFCWICYLMGFFFVLNLQHGGLVSLHYSLSPKSDSLFSHLLLPPCLCLSHTLTVLTVWVSWWEFLFGIRRTSVRARWRAYLHVRTGCSMPYWTDTERVGAVYIQVLSLYVCVFVCQLPECASVFGGGGVHRAIIWSEQSQADIYVGDRYSRPKIGC